MNLSRTLKIGLPLLAAGAFFAATAYAGPGCSSKTASASTSCSSKAKTASATTSCSAKTAVQTASVSSCGTSQASSVACTTSSDCFFEGASVVSVDNGAFLKVCGESTLQASSGCASKVSAADCAAACAAGAKTASASSCGSKVTTASASSCGSKVTTASASSCGSKVKTASAGSKTADNDCGFVVPRNIEFTKIEVPGGVDFVFVGSALASMKGKGCCDPAQCQQMADACGNKVSFSTGEGYMVLSIRGDKAQSCCGNKLEKVLRTATAQVADQSVETQG